MFMHNRHARTCNVRVLVLACKMEGTNIPQCSILERNFTIQFPVPETRDFAAMIYSFLPLLFVSKVQNSEAKKSKCRI